MEFQDDVTSLSGMTPLPNPRAREVQLAYTDGYLLALQDVLRAIAEHKAWATPPQNIETQSYFGGATRMHKKVRMSIEAMIVATKQKLHMIKEIDTSLQILKQDIEILERLKETDGPE